MKKCKNCGLIFNPLNTLQKYCFEKECVGAWISEEKQNQWKKKKKTMIDAMKTTRDLVNELQIIFNRWIRLRDQNKTCISCNTILTKEMKYDAGHFYPCGSYPNLRFEPFNVHAQCVHCNRDRHGNLHEYRNGLIKRYGIKEVERLDQLKNGSNKWTKEDLMEMKKMYLQLIRLKKESSE